MLMMNQADLSLTEGDVTAEETIKCEKGRNRI